MAAAEPVREVNVCVVPVMVTGPALASDALPVPTTVNDMDAPTQADGIDVSTMLVTVLFVDVQEIPMPANEPHELVVALAPLTCFGLGATAVAAALPGHARIARVSPASAAMTEPSRTTDQPVMTTETPVTLAALMLLALKSGVAFPDASRVPVTSASEAFEAPVSVTL